MDSRGELTSTQIIIIVIAILGFGLVLIALFFVDFGGYSQQDICKLSVLTRATTPSAAQHAIPLKCVTQKICITESLFGGACKEQFAGESNVDVIRLSGSVDSRREKIEEISANAMYDCWSMMGEGKLDLFGSPAENFGVGKVTSSCVICSRVAIDKSVGNDTLYFDGNSRKLSAIKINDYMKTHQVPGQSLTYLQAFTDRGVSSFGSVADSDITKLGTTDLKYIPSNNDLAFLFMQVKTKSVGDVLSNLGTAAAGAGAAVFFSPAGGLAGKILGVVAGAVGPVVAIIGAAGVAVVGGSIATYNALESQKVAAMHCGEFVSESSTKSMGCSIVQGISYRFDTINQICGTIEGEL